MDSAFPFPHVNSNKSGFTSVLLGHSELHSMMHFKVITPSLLTKRLRFKYQ